MIRSVDSLPAHQPIPVEPLIQFSFPARGELRLNQTGRLADPTSPDCRRFLDRILPFETIRRVALDPSRQAVEISYPPQQPRGEFLAQFILRLSQEPSHATAVSSRLCLDRSLPGPVEIYRHSGGVSTWRIVHELPGRIRVRHHEMVGRPDVARSVQQKLDMVDGVERATSTSRTGSVLIEFDVRRLTTSHLMYLLEGWLRDLTSPVTAGYEHVSSPAAVSHATLGLATAADFVLPALAPVSAGLLLLTNIGTLRDAGRELRRMRPGVATLYTTIVGGTLASGFFFSAAVMAWLMHYWDRRYHRRLMEGQRVLVLERRRLPHFVWRCRGSTEVETPIDQLRVGDVIAVRAGDLIPADGTVVAGSAEVNERPIGGQPVPHSRTMGEQVFAATRIVCGRLRIQVSRIGRQTRAAVIGDLVESATTPQATPLKSRGASTAAQAVPATLVAAGAGLAVGDLSTALAILRPDYASGPGMAGPMGTVEDVVRALSAGVVIHRGDLLERLRNADLLVLDQSPGCRLQDLPPQVDFDRCGNTETAALKRRCRTLQRRIKIQVWLDPSYDTSLHAWSELGIDVVAIPQDEVSRTARMRAFSSEGRRVVYVGDCHQFAKTASAASVAISSSEIRRADAFEPDAFLLAPEFSHILKLWELAVGETWRHRIHQAVSALPNACCVAGAFLLGFTPLHAVVLTNLGTATLFGLRDYRLNHAHAAGRASQPRESGWSTVDARTSSGFSDEKNRIPWRQFSAAGNPVSDSPQRCAIDPTVDATDLQSCDSYPRVESGAEEMARRIRDQETMAALQKLPMSVGVMLLGLGIVGVLVPGPVGTPLVIAGGLALAPRTFSRFDAVFKNRCPCLHRTGMRILGRFVHDFSQRYPENSGK